MRTGNLLKRGWKAAALVTAGVVGGGAAFAVASVPDTSGQIHACVNVTTSGGQLVPSTSGAGPNVTIIDPSAGQHCIPDDPPVTNQTTLSWDVTGPQGLPGGTGPAGGQGAAVKGITNVFTVATPPLTRRTATLGRVSLGSGKTALAFPILSYGQGSAGTSSAGSGADTAKVSLHDITITKPIDKSSPTLQLACASGKHIIKATITVRKAGGSKRFLQINLSNVIVSSIQRESSSGKSPVPLETITLNFTKIESSYK